MIILDTNLLSELMRSTPSAAVVHWVASQPGSSLYTTTITQAEMLYGVAILPRGRRRQGLATAVAQLFEIEFSKRVLPFDADAARSFARLAALRRLAGLPISQPDAQIAGIADSRNAAIATRNVADFEGCGIKLHNPWRD